jgi:hypothetical protein
MIEKEFQAQAFKIDPHLTLPISPVYKRVTREASDPVLKSKSEISETMPSTNLVRFQKIMNKREHRQ